MDCHGGDPDLPGMEGMDRKRGFRGKPSHREIPEFCASCHSRVEKMRSYGLPTDQLAEYRTSVHGKLLYGKDDPNVAVCTSCHGKHDIRRRTDPASAVYRTRVPALCGSCHSSAEAMDPYGIPVTQQADFEQGIHGRILAGKVPGKNPTLAPNCATCHGVHGATPPGVSEVEHVCAQCHTAVDSYFRQSAHHESIRAGGEPRCTTCHGNHSNRRPTLAVFTGTAQGECGHCHEPGSAALEFASNARQLLGSVEEGVAEVREALSRAEAEGRYTGPLQAAYDGARNKLVEAGPVLHAFAVDQLLPVIHEADDRLRMAREEIRNFREERRQRRQVARYAVGMLALIALLLGARLRGLPRSRPPGEPGAGV